jgi:uncharacterized membrane protein
MSLYSEIATFPFVLLIVLVTPQAWDYLNARALSRWVLLYYIFLISLAFILAISTKAVFIYLLPIYLLTHGFKAIKHAKVKNTMCSRRFIIFAAILGLIVGGQSIE